MTELERGWPDENDGDALARTMKRWRNVFSCVAIPLLLLVRFWPIARWPAQFVNTAFYVYSFVWTIAFVLACVFWATLYRYARAGGGSDYARAYTFLSVLLAPIALVGFWVVPILVERDIASGLAAWRRRTAPSPRERARRTALYLACLAVVALPLWFVSVELLLLAPSVAFFLQRLVLPRIEAADERPA